MEISWVIPSFILVFFLLHIFDSVYCNIIDGKIYLLTYLPTEVGICVNNSNLV